MAVKAKLYQRLNSLLAHYREKKIGPNEKFLETFVDAAADRAFDKEYLDQNDLLQIISEAEALQKNFKTPYISDRADAHFAIKRLGRDKSKKDMKEKSDELIKTAQDISHILAAFEEDIKLSVVKTQGGGSGTDINFIISCDKFSESALKSIIRGSYVTLHTEEVSRIPQFRRTVYAKGRALFYSNSDDTERKRDTKVFSWVSTVINSMPDNADYSVTVRITPVEDTSTISARISELNRLHNLLKYHSERSLSNNLVFGVSKNTRESTIAESIKKYKGYETLGDSLTTSVTVGGNDTNESINILLENLSNEIRRLRYALSSQAWRVSMIVSSDSETAQQTITSILSGVCEKSGIRLEWGSSPDSAFIANTREILPLLLFPTKEFCGFEFVENEDFSLVSPSNTDNGFMLGNILWNKSPLSPFFLSGKALNRHAFVCGMTGAGKTNTVFRLIEGVNRPFCVIEPVKGEYRGLKSLYSDLKVWTMKATDKSDSSVSVMRINPFWFPDGSNIAFHIDSIKTIIASAFELSAAMPNILEQCLYNVYVKAGWDMVTNRNIYRNRLPELYLYPTFSDLCNEIEDYLDHAEFGEEVLGNYRGAMLTRLRSFVSGFKGLLLNTNLHPDYSEIMSGRTVIELEGLADDADKCLVMGTILVQYYQYLKLHFSENASHDDMRHLLVIEEAHRLFKNTSTEKRADEANAAGQLTESLSNMMAEIRAFGEGMLIVDQSPTKIAEDIIKNSSTKIIHRIDNERDIKMIRSSMLLPDELLSFAALSRGEAIIRSEGMLRPCKVKVDRSLVKDSYSLSSSFAAAENISNELSTSFIAGSIIQNSSVSELSEELVMRLLHSLALTRMKGWYEMISGFFIELIGVLKRYHLYDVVDDRMSVLCEIVSKSVTRVFTNESKWDLGCTHMFLMRLLDFYCEKKYGGIVRESELYVFERFLVKPEAILVMRVLNNMDENAYASFCAACGLPQESLFSACLYRTAVGVSVDSDTPDEITVSYIQDALAAEYVFPPAAHNLPPVPEIAADIIRNSINKNKI